MTQDKSKKTLRHFQCRDYLWDLFEQMSEELECSPDYLINESMRQYARSRNYATGSHAANLRAPRPTAAWTAPVLPPDGLRTDEDEPATVSRSLGSAKQAGDSQVSRKHTPPELPEFQDDFETYASSPTFSTDGRSSYQASPGRYSARANPGLAGPPSSLPPEAGGRGATVQSSTESRPALYAVLEGKRYLIHKDEFVIGRGARSSDLAIKDGNISRRHAAIVFADGRYVLRDLGSTNGIEYGGRRVSEQEIHDGDTFHLCDYELKFFFG